MKKILFTKEIPIEILKEKLHSKFEFDCVPFLGIEILPEQKFKSKILTGTNYIVTSQNAVKAISNLNLKEHFFVVGKKTAEKLKKLNFHVEHFENSVVELGKYLVENKHPISWNYFCGKNRRDELIEILKEKKHSINEIICYESFPNEMKIQTENYSGFVFFSPLGVRSFFKKNKIPLNSTIFAIGKTTETELNHFTNQQIIIPQIPTIENLITKINEYYD